MQHTDWCYLRLNQVWVMIGAVFIFLLFLFLLCDIFILLWVPVSLLLMITLYNIKSSYVTAMTNYDTLVYLMEKLNAF